MRVQMLGKFSIQMGEKTIDDQANRTKKVWLLLAYMIYNRTQRLTQQQYLSVLLGDCFDDAENPAGRLKALFYRARAQLNELEDRAGHRLIVHKNSLYSWNPEIPVHLDAEEFDKLCRLAARETDTEKKLSVWLQAMDIYKGDFLPKLAAESWVMPINAYYHRIYLETAQQTLSALQALDRWEEAAVWSRKALKIEPYSEELYQFLMRALIATGDRSGAVAAYEQMSQLLFDQFGVMPSEDSRQLYREAYREVNEQAVPVDTVRDQLRETVGQRGAMLCEYDFFKLLYQVQARALVRSGDVIHIALLSVQGQDGQGLSRRSLDTAMDNLCQLVLDNLRQGDVVTRCSASQIIVMLPQANYENSCTVCQRLIKAFRRQYPHSPAQVQYSVQPLEPAKSPNTGSSAIVT